MFSIWKKMIITIVITGLIFTSYPTRAAETGKKIEIVKIQAVSLKNNLLKEPIEQDLVIYLPPSYSEAEKTYPVVYFISGFSRYPIDIVSLADYFEKAMEEANFEFIVVGVNCRNKLGGSFGVNSPIIGDWEDYIVKDVVEYVDSNYRTIVNPNSRGIAGWSMGGFAAINLGLKHPDLFSVVYGLAPGLFDENGLCEAFKTWDSDSTFIMAYGAAFSPNPKAEYPYGETPKFDNTEADNIIRANWENGYGNLKQKIDFYLQRKIPLKTIQIVYGQSDCYSWIPKGCIYFSNLLKENNIPYELRDFLGGHDLGLIRKSFVTFFAENMKSE